MAMYWVNEAMGRYYHAGVVRDLFGGLVVVRTTGGVYSHRGRSMSYPVDDELEADKMLLSVAAARRRHGYALKEDSKISTIVAPVVGVQ